MDQVPRIPKILSSIKDLQQPNHQSTSIQKIKQEVSTFIHDVKSQFSTIIRKYQQQISQLKMESEILKRSRNTTQKNEPSKRALSSIIKHQKQQDFLNSPILPLRSNKFYQTTNSKFYTTKYNQKQPFTSWGSAFQIRNTSPNQFIQTKHKNIFPQQLINPQFQNQRTFHRSRFERNSQRKRQRQEQIVHFLQSHKKNLDETTTKMMGLIGKNVKESHQGSEGSQHQQHEENNHKSNDDLHNQSLSQICDSLDKSFVSQKARKSKLKKKQAQQIAKKKKIEQQNHNQKLRKQRALKNLLQRLRQNANSVNPPQMVKASKLIPTGPKNSTVFKPAQSLVLRKNSKVMINPVPVHSFGNKMRQSSPKLPQKRPTSILKQSSNILTRSISGISAISFEE